MSLYELQKDALKGTFKKYECNYRHLIVDDTTYPIVKLLFKDDILNYVYTFHKIDDSTRSSNRERAMYLLDPVSPYSVECLLADFSRGKRYNDAVVCLLPGLNPISYKRFRENQFLEEATGGKFDTIEYLSLHPIENRVYVTGGTYSVPAYYNFQHMGKDLVQYQMDRAIDSMMSLCILINEYPIVRYYNHPLSKQLATTFQKKLDEYYRRHPDLAPANSKTVFLITERAMDLFGAFCHYKYYRSQIFDLMDDHVRRIRGDYTFVYDYEIKTGEGMEKKHLVFDSEDPIYTDLKDLKIEEYTQKIQQLLASLKKEDDRYKNSKYTSDLSHLVLNQGDHMFNKQLVTGHFQLISQIQDQFEAEQLLDAIVFENKCASSLSTRKHLHEPVTDELVELLANEKIFMGNKIRLLIVYAIYRGGLVESDFYKLLRFGMPDKTESVLELIRNLEKLGFHAIKPSLSVKRRRENTFFGVKDTQELTERMVPTFSNLVLHLAEDKLPELYTTQVDEKNYYARGSDDIDDDDKTFPYVKGAPVDDLDESMGNIHLGTYGSSTVRNQPKWKSTRPSDSKLTRQKLLIFCAGGLTQSELSTMISLEPTINRNIFIGADEIYSTWDLLGDIRMINDKRENFKFELDKKFENRKPPAFLYDNSPNPKELQPHPTKRQEPKREPETAHHLHHHQHHKTSENTGVKDEKRKRDKFMKKLKSLGK
ncbi:DEKNAAC101747 [Brettanomyces naardenensis]|uniref:DEKNAAC101747 n=1 Tax=Brettanomyces naardenensis TaxID=13370 RepID=A0A448YJ04_BRENA|nr:DEKNAAC101747 [Brettanomyces naardenensis]